MEPSAGENAKAEAEREGYTSSQAATYGALKGTEEGVKVAALSGLSQLGRVSSVTSSVSLPVGVAGVATASYGLEFVDEALVDPTIRYNVLNDENAYKM